MIMSTMSFLLEDRKLLESITTIAIPVTLDVDLLQDHYYRLVSIRLRNSPIMLFSISQIFCLLCSFLCFPNMNYADNSLSTIQCICSTKSFSPTLSCILTLEILNMQS